MATVIFMGTPDFAVPSLQALIAQHDVIGVVTQPDRPAGRKGELRQPPVKICALQHDIPVIQPERLRRPEGMADLQGLGTPDLIVVAAFGQILPQAVLDFPRFGAINVHGSLLPRWRGAAPIHAAIRAGDTETGITIMLMDAGLDTGPMLSKAVLPIESDETGATLHDKMASLGAQLLASTLPHYLDGSLPAQPQDDSIATYAPQIRKEEGLIDWSQDAQSIERLVRAFTPWPGTFTQWQGKQLKIHRGAVRSGQAAPGHVLISDDQALCVGTSAGLYEIQELQLEGKKRISAGEFLRGYPDFAASSLGQ